MWIVWIIGIDTCLSDDTFYGPFRSWDRAYEWAGRFNKRVGDGRAQAHIVDLLAPPSATKKAKEYAA